MMPRLADLRSRVAAGELDCEDEYRELEARVREATTRLSTSAPEVAADRALRKMKKRLKAITKNLKRPERKDREHIKGKVIDGKHEQYVLTLGMMMGIRQTLLSQANDIDADTAAAAPRPEALAVGDFLECRFL